MKKILLTISAIVLLVAMVFSFSSCGALGKPELDIDTLEDIFEDEEYDQVTTIGKEERKALEACGIYGVEDGILVKEEVDLEFVFGGIDSLLELDYCVLVFETKEQANTYHKYLNSMYYIRYADMIKDIKFIGDVLDNCSDDIDSDTWDNYSDRLKDIQEDFDSINSISIGKYGNTIWITTDAALEVVEGN